MITSQFFMVGALALIGCAWGMVRRAGHRGFALQQIFAALLVQAVAAVTLSFSTANWRLSVALAAVILIAVGWMVFGIRERARNAGVIRGDE